MPFPSLGDLPNPGIKPTSPAVQVDSLPVSHLRSPNTYYYILCINNDAMIENRKTFPFSHFTAYVSCLAGNPHPSCCPYLSSFVGSDRGQCGPAEGIGGSAWGLVKHWGQLPGSHSRRLPPSGGHCPHTLGKGDVPQISVEFCQYLLTQHLLNYQTNPSGNCSSKLGAVLSEPSLDITAPMS